MSSIPLFRVPPKHGAELGNRQARVTPALPVDVLGDQLVIPGLRLNGTVRAKEMLLYTDKSIKEISYDMGFQSIYYFSRIFKNKLGVSPSEIRKTVE